MSNPCIVCELKRAKVGKLFCFRCNRFVVQSQLEEIDAQATQAAAEANSAYGFRLRFNNGNRGSIRIEVA